MVVTPGQKESIAYMNPITSLNHHLQTHKRTLFVSLKAHGGLFIDTTEHFQTWLKNLVALSGLRQESIAVWAVFLSEPVPHIHALISSHRHRSGDITTLSAGTYQLLREKWESLHGEGAEASLRRVYDREGLATYLSGWDNISYPGQTVIELHNMKQKGKKHEQFQDFNRTTQKGCPL